MKTSLSKVGSSTHLVNGFGSRLACNGSASRSRTYLEGQRMCKSRPIFFQGIQNTNFSAQRDMRVRDALDNIADAIRPGIVPRPIAKGLILFLGASFVWSLVQKLLSFTLVIGVLGGGAYLYAKSKTDNLIGDSSSKSNDNDDDNPLASARKIMDKYK